MSTLCSNENCLSNVSWYRVRELTISTQVVVQLLAKRLWVVKELQCREVGRNGVGLLLPFFVLHLLRLVKCTLALMARFVDLRSMLGSADVLSRVADGVFLVSAFVVAVGIGVGAEEEVDSGRLDLCVWVERSESSDGDCLGIRPTS